MKEFRVVSAFSTELEKQLIEDPANVDFEFISSIIFELKKHRNSILLLIPQELRSYFQIGRMRLIYDQICRPQSNIIFTNGINCNAEYFVDERAVAYTYTKNIITLIISGGNYPFIITNKSYCLTKIYCSDCSQVSTMCQISMCQQYQPTSITDIEHTAKLITELNLQDNYVQYFVKNPIVIYNLIVSICRMRDINSEDIERYNNVEYSPHFFDDIKDISANELKFLAFSMFRAVAYPSSRTKDRNKNSIDWHPNTIKKANGYNLYRVDVISYNKTGLVNSGASRVLLGIKDGKRKFLAYTSEHDFSKAKINKCTQ